MKQLLLSEAEFQSLAGLLDAAVKSVGLRAVPDTAAIIVRMEAATDIADPPENKPHKRRSA